MAISGTPALFARVDLFSRSRVIFCYLREIIFSCRRKHHWNDRNIANCAQVVITVREVSRLTDGLLDEFGTQVLKYVLTTKSYNQRFCRLCKLVDIHLYFTV